jgi:sugar lactone lactonase YvrE
MTEQQTLETRPAEAKVHTGRLFVLEINAGKVHTVNPDGSGKRTIVTGARNPDGIVVDAAAGHIYWTNMGNPKSNDGSIERADLDGGNRVFIVPPGETFTPKQLQLEKDGGKLYWSDREGMRVMRVNLDGSKRSSIVRTATRAPVPTLTNGASESRSIRATVIYIGRKRVRTMARAAGCAAHRSSSVRERMLRAARTSRSCSIRCPSRSISISIPERAFFTGPTAAIRRAATASIAPISTQSPARQVALTSSFPT